MKSLHKNPLPKKLNGRDALTHESSKIKPRFTKGFWRLINNSKFALISLLVLFLLTFQPAATFPPISQSKVLAQESGNPQKQEITSNFLPQISLPHPGYVSTHFSRWHPGVDIATGLGMPINPISDGMIAEVNMGFFGYGNHVIISHPANLRSLYGHMDRVYVKKGQKVTRQDMLGTVGMTGWTSGPHTHLEVTKDGGLIDPLTVLPQIQDYPSEEYLKPYGGAGAKTVSQKTKLANNNTGNDQGAPEYVILNPAITPLTDNLPLYSIDRTTPSELLPLSVNQPLH